MALLLAVLATGCAAATSAHSRPTSQQVIRGQFVVGYVSSPDLEPSQAPFRTQLQRYVAGYGDLRLATSGGTAAAQVHRLIRQHVAVLVLSSPSTGAVRQACAAGVAVIVLDRPVGTTCYRSYIHPDNYRIGLRAGRLAVKLLAHGGNAVELQGPLSDPIQLARDRGFRDAIRADPSIHLVRRSAGWKHDTATAVTRRLLHAHSSVDLIYAQNDAMALGADSGTSGDTSHVHIIGTDGSTDGIGAVELGKLTATFTYPTGASQATATAERLVHHRAVAKNQVLTIAEVTPQNAAALNDSYNGQHITPTCGCGHH